DVVWAVESICHAADKAAFYREARRLLRPGGRLGIVEYMRTQRPLPDQGEARLRSWLSGWAIPDIATAAEHRGSAATSGFDNVVLIDITSQVRRSLGRLHRMASLAWPAALLLRALRIRSVAQHGNVRGARDQFRALRAGLWFDALHTPPLRRSPQTPHCAPTASCQCRSFRMPGRWMQRCGTTHRAAVMALPLPRAAHAFHSSRKNGASCWS